MNLSLLHPERANSRKGYDGEIESICRLSPPFFDRVTLVDPLFDPDWDQSVSKYQECSFFHTSAWARVLNKTYGHQPIYLCCTHQNTSVALIPLMEVSSSFTGVRGICLPFSDYCAPLVSDVSYWQPIVELLHATALRRGWKYFEMRGGQLNGAVASETFYGHCLDLRHNVEWLLASFSGSVRRAILKAERSALKVELLRSREAMLDFYQLHVETRRQFGIPPQSLSFFLNIFKEIIEPGLGFVVLAKTGVKAISAAVFFHSGKKAIYKFGASNRAFQDLRANNLVMWEGIRSLATNGAETLHFGRTSLNGEGLRRFKRGWGTQEEIIHYHKFNIAKSEWAYGMKHAASLHEAIFRRLPLPVNRVLGALLYPHLD